MKNALLLAALLAGSLAGSARAETIVLDCRFPEQVGRPGTGSIYVVDTTKSTVTFGSFTGPATITPAAIDWTVQNQLYDSNFGDHFDGITVNHIDRQTGYFTSSAYSPTNPRWGGKTSLICEKSSAGGF